MTSDKLKTRLAIHDSILGRQSQPIGTGSPTGELQERPHLVDSQSQVSMSDEVCDNG
nr:hypothetical protein [uncultured Cohaesibacter sp.]